MCSTIIGDVLHFPFAAIDGAGDSLKIGVGVGVGVSLLLLLLLLLLVVPALYDVFQRRKNLHGTCTYDNLCMLIVC